MLLMLEVIVQDEVTCFFYVSVIVWASPQVEQQGAQLETFQQRNLLLQEENNVLMEKMNNLER